MTTSRTQSPRTTPTVPGAEPLMDLTEALERFEPVLGLEVHVELNTASKMFCGCPTGFGSPPNTQTCPVCLGLPGALPVLNESAVAAAIRIGLALNCEIAESCRFARKNYFYPDMPKNFQTSQYDEPIAYNGWTEVLLTGSDPSGGVPQNYRIEIERAHMEEDTGKSTHIGGATGRIHGAAYSLVDYNRAGIPLIEIVTKTIEVPPHRAAAVARAYVTHLRDLFSALGVSDVRMDQGSLRCDANVSLKPAGSPQLGTRTETKNLNSFRSIERAVNYEIRRQAAILAAGHGVTQETRHWHEDTAITTSGRVKSDAEDYRYFPEPDLVPVAPPRTWVDELRASLPENPAERRSRLHADWAFSELEMRDVLNAGATELIEQTVAAGAGAQAARKWWMGELARAANAAGSRLADLGVTPAQVAEVQELVESGALNDKLARQVFAGLLRGEGSPQQVIDARGLALVCDDTALGAAVDRAIASNPEVVAKVKGGKTAAAGALIGAVMKELGGQADAATVRRLVDEKLA